MTDTELYDDEQYEDEPGGWHAYDERPPRSRLPRVVLAVVVLALLVGGLGAVWLQRKIDPPGGAGAEVTLTIPKGSSTARIAAILDSKGVISSATIYRYYLRVKGEGAFEAGTYKLRRNDDFNSVTRTLRKGPVVVYQRLTIPEGKTLKQIAALVGALPGRSAAKFLQLAASGEVRSTYEPAGVNNLEGLLFPDTYNFQEKDDELVILKRLVAEFETRAAGSGADDPPARLKVTPYQALIVASLVETESKVDADRAKIAQVIYNRMARGMPLQIDATVLYAREATGAPRRPNGRVLFSDLEIASPYNTYKVKGLPPTPIAAPGAASLEAALNPEAGPWLFYVKFQADGTHAFATTLAEHNRNIADAKRRGINP
jgi:UPF0755 protein